MTAPGRRDVDRMPPHSLRASDDLWNAVKAHAAANGTDVSELTRTLWVALLEGRLTVTPPSVPQR